MNPVLFELQPLAKSIRERQLQIDQAGQDAMAQIATILGHITEQGRDIINAKTHLGRLMSWGDWLKNHVPNLDPKQAAKYERITVEGITDPRQAVFAFMPEPDRRPLPKRTPADQVERAWGHLHKFLVVVRDYPLAKWTEAQREHVRAELDELLHQLWPDVFAGPHTTQPAAR